MTMQRLCHQRSGTALLTAICLCSFGPALGADPPANNYPTHARVEYVQECIAAHGGHLSNLYQCSCVIDRIADKITYDDFVEAGTFARYSGLPGEGGALFRDSDHARQMAKLYRDTESEAARTCGLTH
ncbi:MAG: hypothetical protein ACJ8OJ_09610 [Povalibacter sp.]|jgi:hypothetical protein